MRKAKSSHGLARWILSSTGSAFAHHPRLSHLGSLACIQALAAAQNAHRYDMERNGEDWLISRLAALMADRPVLDVGANSGAWTARVLAKAPTAHVFAVEMLPHLAVGLRDRFGDKVTVIECALSDETGTATAYAAGGGGQLVRHDTEKTLTPVEVSLRTGDSLVEERGITDISMIKVDVDGYDVPVLRGLARTIARDRPIVQFEYSRFYIETRHYLRDAFRFFEEHDYRIGRLLPRHVAFMEWSRSMELFLTNNYVAIPSERRQLF